jgi:hypothetical protein
LASLGAADGRSTGGAGLRTTALLRRFAAFGALALIFFFMGIFNSGASPREFFLRKVFFLEKASFSSRTLVFPQEDLFFFRKTCRSSPRQDSPFRTPCHALPNLGPIL